MAGARLSRKFRTRFSPAACSAMGWRSIRLTLDRPFLLRQQLRALIRATAGVELRVMFPMIATVGEFDDAREIFATSQAWGFTSRMNGFSCCRAEAIVPPKDRKMKQLGVPFLLTGSGLRQRVVNQSCLRCAAAAFRRTSFLRSLRCALHRGQSL